MPDQEPNVNALQMAAQMQNFLAEAAEYIIKMKSHGEEGTTKYAPPPSQNLIEGAEMIKAFNG